MAVAYQVLSTNEFEERTAPIVVQIDAHSDLADVEMGIMQSAGALITISGQIDNIPGRSHKDIVAHLYSAMFCVPKSEGRLLWANPECLLALNFTVGVADHRPCSSLHVWDLVGPSSSLGSNDSTADTIIAVRANFSAADWDGPEPYGQ